MSRAAYLILENGTVFEGKAFGAEKETTGELVFTTAMTGYLETLTRPQLLRSGGYSDIPFNRQLWCYPCRF